MSSWNLRSVGQVLVVLTLAALVVSATSVKELTSVPSWEETTVEIAQVNTGGCDEGKLYFDSRGMPLSCQDVDVPVLPVLGEGRWSEVEKLARHLGADGFSENDRDQVQAGVDQQIANRPAEEQRRLDELRQQAQSGIASWWVAIVAFLVALSSAVGAWALLKRSPHGKTGT